MASASSSTAPAASSSRSNKDAELLPPIPKSNAILVIGMAGSGKSTFAGALSRHLEAEAAKRNTTAASSDPSASSSDASYLVNLDPAVSTLNYEPNVDIRDTVDYKRVMDEYNLGPNGGILTALNLFTTKFDQVMGILEGRSNEVDNIVLDTPGQIEIFTWSASGTIITDSLASALPTCIAYVVDTPRTTAPATFMSNMLYACSIMYKTKLPFIIVFNKEDEQDAGFAREWMEDFEAFQEALNKGNATDQVDVGRGNPRARGAAGQEGEASYMNSLVNSMALLLEEFYNSIRAVSVSSLTGSGMPSFLSAVQEARQEYVDEYRPELEALRASRKQKQEERKKREVEKMMRDLRVKPSGKAPPKAATGARGGSGEVDDDDEEDPRITRMADRMRVPGYEGDGLIMEPDDDDVLLQTHGAAQTQAGQVPRRGGGAQRGEGEDLASVGQRRREEQLARARLG